MPTPISRGAAAARAFGFTGSQSGQLYTQTFTSNGTFTPMAGVTNVVTLVGQGGSSSSDFQTTSESFIQRNTLEPYPLGSGPNPLPVSFLTVAQYVIDIVNLCNTGGIQSFNYTTDSYTTVYPDQTWSQDTDTPYTFTAYMIPGTWSVITEGFVPYPPVGQVTSYAQAQTSYGVYRPQGQYIAAGSAGGNSSALGYTFSGAAQVGTYPTATGQSATPVTYNNVAVTPGTGYPIVVGAGGSVKISFIIP